MAGLWEVREEIVRSNFALVEVKDVAETHPAIFYELQAAKYLGISRPTFRNLVFSGIIPYAMHIGGKVRIYRRSDLDSYIAGLNWRKMTPREHPLVALKGAE